MSGKEPKHGQHSSIKTRNIGKFIFCVYCNEWIRAIDWHLHKTGIICKKEIIK